MKKNFTIENIKIIVNQMENLRKSGIITKSYCPEINVDQALYDYKKIINSILLKFLKAIESKI